MTPVSLSADEQQGRPEDALVTEAARRDLPQFLSAAFKDNEGSGYGFKPGDGQSSVSLGAPMRVFGLDSGLLAKDLKNSKMADLVEPVGEWIFPVLAGEDYRAVFGVRNIGGTWTGAYLGNPRLARMLQDLRQTWHTGERDDFLLISCPEPRGFLFTVTTAMEENLTPLTSLGLKGEQTLTPTGNLRELKSATATLESLASYWQTEEQSRSQ